MTAGHFSLGAFALADAGGTGVCKKRRRRFAAKTKHFIRNGAKLPLGAVAAAKAEEIVKAADVHGNHHFCLAGIRKHKARVFIRDF